MDLDDIEEINWFNILFKINKILSIVAAVIWFLPSIFFILVGLYCLAFSSNKPASLYMISIGFVPYVLWIMPFIANKPNVNTAWKLLALLLSLLASLTFGYLLIRPLIT